MAPAALSEGQPATDFTLPDSDGTPVTLSTLRGGWVVVYFYPKDDTPGCTAESCAFRDSYEDFVEAGATVIGISSDSPESHKAFAATLGVIPGRVTFVIDPDGVVRKRFSSQFKAAAHQAEALATITGSGATSSS